MRTKRTTILFSLLLYVGAVFTTGYVYGQDISFSAEVSSNKVALGSAVQLTLTISGMTDVGELELPPLDNFDVKYLGPSTHVSIVNGKYYSSKSFTYSLLPKKTGRFVIQPFSFSIKGKNYSTQAIEIEVVDSQTQMAPGSQNVQARLRDKINLVLRVPKKYVYLNEALPVKVMLLVSDLSVRDIRYPQIGNIGFMVSDFDQPKQYQQIINGIRYDIVEFDTVLYPTRTGELTLGPAQLDCNLLVKGTQRRSLGSLFDDEFFNAFFDRAEKRPITLESEPVTITVKNLPEEGRPKDFSGAVGNFDFEVTASPTDLKVGDPITLREKIKGRGNLTAIEFPEFAGEQKFKIYKPNIKDEKNVKTLEQVIIPLSEDVEEVPAQSFSFFDPQLEKYRTIARGPFPVDVEPLKEGEQLNAVGLQQPVVAPAQQQEKLGEDIVFIKEQIGALRRVGTPLYERPLYYAVLVIAAGLWLFGFGYFKWTHRLATDEAFARKMLAPKQAKKHLSAARHLLDKGDAAAFYDALFKTLQGYLADKLQIPAGAVSAESVKEKLSGPSFEKMTGAVERILSECESVRYASVSLDQPAMKKSYHDTERIIDYLERHLR